MDGGVAWNLDIAAAVEKCQTLVDSDDKIYLDVIDVDRSFADITKWNNSGKVISNYLRHRNLRNFYYRMDDELEIYNAYPNVNYRYLIIPQI